MSSRKPFEAPNNMRTIALLSPLLSLGGWILAALAATHMLSGYMDERTCQTGCVQVLFFSALGVGLVALVLGLMSVFRAQTRIPGGLALLLALPLCGVLGGIVVIGNVTH